MARSRPEKKRSKAKPVPGMPPPEPPGTTRILPMQLQIGDRMTDSTGEWEAVGRPYSEPYFLNYRSTSRRSRARCQRIRAIIWPNFARALAHLDLNADGFGRGLVLPPDQRPEIARVSGATGSIGRQPCRPWSPSRLMLVVFSRTSCPHWRFGEPTSSGQPALARYRGPASAIGPSRATTAPAPAYSSAAVPETNVGRASHQFTHRRSIHLA